MSTATSTSKMAKMANSVKLHKLAAKLAERHQNKVENKAARKAKAEQAAPEFQNKMDRNDAKIAAYEAKRCAEYEKDPTSPRSVEWKREQDKQDRLAKSRWARLKKNAKTFGIFCTDVAKYILKRIIVLIIAIVLLAVLIPFAIMQCLIQALRCCTL
ncbi:hypothetical protein VM1G_05737 [Cytospora mali]|uniref:Uncharacterized protein n=1 Tax=Cytospora mali TaxID=578113 RepID=A0A194W1Y2_CYTMA|nr:hypothetical protein VM1G_05737 [Valsa mali]